MDFSLYEWEALEVSDLLETNREIGEIAFITSLIPAVCVWLTVLVI